ncbi:MAG: ATP-grasp domain-containing protein [Bacteriovoracaceae bacterium]|nr:ATP-grasp domain-containing protein [Bacteriovoracaceae bacterium]
MKKFKRVLIANRGEIAIRVAKTLRELDIESVMLFTDEEKDLPHASFGDISINLGSGPLSDTYLNISKLVELCKEHKVDAVHPGYGFLSERAPFAKALKEAGVELIGPPTAAMEAMGDKKTSKEIMEKAGIPLIPGYHGDNQESDFLAKEAVKIGFPILIKASAGGGGKGMRIVEKDSEFQEALESAKREAMNAFGDDKVLIEKYITDPRHIEVQVMSDTHGQHFHFWERECSIQRRYQKIVEESPSPALSQSLREEICQTAVKISETMNYVGAGTVEFILDKDGSFYFLEMNTRLQVEHPITEMVTGSDLVQLQIRVAQGEKLPFTQSEIHQNGHAIEVRIYAENPDQDFMPSIGTIDVVGESRLLGVRLDSGYKAGNEVTTSFDPMIAKLIVWSTGRTEAINKMDKALSDYPFLGLTTNRDYLKRILKHETFREGVTFTHFVKTYADDLKARSLSREEVIQAILAYEFMGTTTKLAENEAHVTTAWDQLSGFRLN